MTTPASTSDREIVVEREYDAPRDLVWEVLTNCEHLKHWFGTRDFPMTHCDLDLRPGGRWHYCLKSADGTESWGLTVYKEIEKPSRLVAEDAFSDPDGNINPPTMQITYTLEERAGKTVYRSHTLFDSAEVLQQMKEGGMEQGITEMLEMLGEYLAKVQS